MQTHDFTLSFQKVKSQRFSVHTPDYLVLFQDVQVGRLSYGDFGYVGLLPDHTGTFHEFPEAPLSEWCKIRDTLIKRGRSAIEVGLRDPLRVDGAYETLNPKIMRIQCGEEEKIVTTHSIFFARKIFRHTHLIPWSFCSETTMPGFADDSPEVTMAKLLMDETDDDVFRTFLYRISTKERPELDHVARSEIYNAVLGMQEKDATQMIASGFMHWFDDAYPECFRGVMNRFLTDLQTSNIWTNEKLGVNLQCNDRCIHARTVEDLIMRLRRTTPDSIWTRSAVCVRPVDIPFKILSDVKELFKAAHLMGVASPLNKTDPELLSFFQVIADYDPIKRRNKMLETLIYDTKRIT